MAEIKDLPGVMNAAQAEECMAWAKTPQGQAALQKDVDIVMRKVHGPDGTKEMFGTGDHPTFKTRVGNCYELAAHALISGAPKGTKLVHGTMHGRGAPRRISHAWLRLPGGKVWEPILARIFDEVEWTDYAYAKVERVYTKPEACRMLVSHGHYGRWHHSRHP